LLCLRKRIRDSSKPPLEALLLPDPPLRFYNRPTRLQKTEVLSPAARAASCAFVLSSCLPIWLFVSLNSLLASAMLS
jgi:hypothetical protein